MKKFLDAERYKHEYLDRDQNWITVTGGKVNYEKDTKSWKMISKLSEMLENMTLVEERWIKLFYMRKSAEFEERS